MKLNPFINGASIHRVWNTLPDGELIAYFQYVVDAKLVADMLIHSQPERSYLITVDHRTGELYIARQSAEGESAGCEANL